MCRFLGRRMDWFDGARTMDQLRNFNDISCDPIFTIGSSDGGGKTKRFTRNRV